MTRLSALLMAGPDVEVVTTGPDEFGRFGFFIGTYDETPSGFKRPRCIASSRTIYPTAEEAIKIGRGVVADARAACADGRV